jgi:hypothetical protein
MSGTALISGNTAKSVNTISFGGGVAVYTNGNFTMEGGTISGNTSYSTNAEGSGGGVSLIGGNFTMSGGVISGNTAAGLSGNSAGGGVYIYSSEQFYKTGAPSGGIIYGNTADSNANVVKYHNGTVINNKGHAVYAGSTRCKDTTVTAAMNLDSTKTGAEGGW